MFLLYLFSCGNEEEEETIESDAIAQEELEEEVDPFYAAIDENSTLEEYWELFVADAIRSGKPDPGYGRTMNLFLEMNLILHLELQLIMLEELMTFVMTKQ